MKKSADYWQPDPAERAAEIAARRGMLEQRFIAPIRARVGLLQNLRVEQRQILDRLIEDVLAQPRDDHELRGALNRLHSYIARRWTDERNAPKPIPEKARQKIVAALEKAGIDATEDEILGAWAKANAVK